MRRGLLSGRPRERGSGMVISLLALAALSLMAVAVFVVMRTVVRETAYQQRKAEAYWTAQAGLEDALHALYVDTTTRSGFTKSFAGGSYTVSFSTATPPEVVSVGASAPLALFGPVTRTIRATAGYDYDPPDVMRPGLPVHVSWKRGTWTASPEGQ